METGVMLEADDLVKGFGDVKAVQGISFQVRRGEIFGFLGPNGAGKTTSIKMLCGLLRPDRGTVKINGEDIFGNDQKSLRSVGICPQNIVVWEGLTCLEQLRFMGVMYGMEHRSARQRSLELLDVLGLLDKRDKLAKTLSGGMQRRLNIALALVHSPDLVFLDEPQAGLDPQSRVLVREYIKAMKDGATVILTTHDMEEADKLSDRVCIIDRGKVLVTGTVDELKKSGGRGDLFEVETKGAVDDELLARLGRIAGVSGLKQLSQSRFSFLSEHDEMLGELMGMLRQKTIPLENIMMRKKSLEDVFIGLTGRGLRE